MAIVVLYFPDSAEKQEASFCLFLGKGAPESESESRSPALAHSLASRSLPHRPKALENQRLGWSGTKAKLPAGSFQPAH